MDAPKSIQNWLEQDINNGPPHRCKTIVKQLETKESTYVTCRADDGTLQTHRIVAMSSLSRRACYKCGNVGHYAEVCSSAERLCYNCEFRCLALFRNEADNNSQASNPVSPTSAEYRTISESD
jgi:hypothetical protein